MVAQAILYPDFPRGLDFIVSIFSDGTPYYKDDGKTYFKFGGSQHEFWKYNCMDCCVLFDAFGEQQKQLVQLGNWNTYLDVAKLIEPLVFMSANGMKVDVEAKNAASALVEKRVLALTEQFQQLCGSAVNPNSPQQLMKYFYETKREKPYKSRTTGNATTDEDALKRLSRKGYEEAKLLLEIRSLEKLNGTYLKMRLDSDNRIRCSYNPVGTVSGRLSSSKNIFGVGGNMQNLPRDNYEFEDNNET
jgi:DNA polymerase I-like protein with 3'-5' exonuclease and polymerase domains